MHLTPINSMGDTADFVSNSGVFEDDETKPSRSTGVSIIRHKRFQDLFKDTAIGLRERRVPCMCKKTAS